MTPNMNYLKLLWERLSPSELQNDTEVERISVLQKTAARRRAEHAEKMEQAALLGDPALHGPLSGSHKRMKEAEIAHFAALQSWENKQARQNSR